MKISPIDSRRIKILKNPKNYYTWDLEGVFIRTSQEILINYTSPNGGSLRFIYYFIGLPKTIINSSPSTASIISSYHRKLNLCIKLCFIFFDKASALIIGILLFEVMFMYSKSLLWDLRTNLPMLQVLVKLKDQLCLPHKESEGFIRFLCINCKEIQATINPKNNLSHCFCCGQNFNNIDLLIRNGYNFSESVELLKDLWEIYKKERQFEATTSNWQ